VLLGLDFTVLINQESRTTERYVKMRSADYGIKNLSL